MTDFSLSSALHASRPAGNHARGKGEDHGQFQMISGLLMVAIGVEMTMDASNKAQARAGKPQMGGTGRSTR